MELTKDGTLSPIKDLLQELKIELQKRYGNKLRKINPTFAELSTHVFFVCLSFKK